MTVANLNDSGSGSLREALEASGTRIVEFSVSGTIELDSQIEITNGNITTDGSTSPNGICIKNNPDNLTVAPIRISASNIIFTHLRIRPEPHPTDSGSNLDALSLGRGSNICIDHCSLTFGTDAVFDIIANGADVADVTIQDTIIAWALKDSTHVDEGMTEPEEHSTGCLITNFTSHDVGDITFLRCLFAFNLDRNPRIETSTGVVEIVNCVGIGNENTLVTLSDANSTPNLNYVKNYHIDDSNASFRGYSVRSGTGNVASIYVEGNYSPSHTDPEDPDEVTGTRHTAPTITAEMSATAALTYVLANAGATLPCRDDLDELLIDFVNAGFGDEGVINNPAGDVGAWPVLSCGVEESGGSDG